jgi:ribulose-5-phosphate 4-epimerase/fuculose-1-phosphate aldolase
LPDRALFRRRPGLGRQLAVFVDRAPHVPRRQVIHTHAPHANILALAGRPFLPISTEAAFIGEIPRVPFILPGSRELAEQVVRSMGAGSAVLMRNHGLVVSGPSLRRAVDVTKIIEQTAMQILACYASGREPPVLPDDVVRALSESEDMVG